MRLRNFHLVPCVLMAASLAFGQSRHYLDCGEGNDASDSLTPQTAWRSIAKTNSYTFQPGDRLLLRRGSHCDGMLWPKGSGTEIAPIYLGAYGLGALPSITGGREDAGLKLDDQQFWEIEDLEIAGGSPYGIHIGGTEPELRHFRITNVVVHDVQGVPSSKDTGLVVIAPDDKSRTRLEDVIIDGVTAYRTSEWAGIIVNGSGFDAGDQSDRGDHVEIRNSIVHDVAGDGILLARVSHGVLEHNVAWFTGMQETQSIGTPNAIWEWRCSDCRVEYNEGFFSDSPGVDGGIFDIDYGDIKNRVESNFGHDSQGYCISVFGADGASGDTTQSVIRNNTCIHNGRSPRLAKRQGAVFLYTWNGGKLEGVDAEDNRILWDPPTPDPAIQPKAEFQGSLPNKFANNMVIAVSGLFVAPSTGIEFSGNRYCGPIAPSKDAAPGTGPSAHAKNDGQQVPSVEFNGHGNHFEAICDCMQSLRASTSADSLTTVRHVAPELSVLGIAKNTMDFLKGHWTLLAMLAPPGETGSAASRSDLVLIDSMLHQFSSLGLASLVVPLSPIKPDDLKQWQIDWGFDPRILIDATPIRQPLTSDGNALAPMVMLISPEGKTVSVWRDSIPPSEVWLALESRLGTPAGMQQMPHCKSEAAR
ncbi:MAG TPA: right-handed parallel beta-helix repeat-containing protein [Terracidiphilus sp.]|jgi:hypothetical protein|nr:right-handed parallel beta-helix repeat-containing protein [Terracidiphilus sp.]